MEKKDEYKSKKLKMDKREGLLNSTLEKLKRFKKEKGAEAP